PHLPRRLRRARPRAPSRAPGAPGLRLCPGPRACRSCPGALTHLERLLHDSLEQRPGFPALRRSIRNPDVRVVLREDVREVSLARHAERCELSDVERTGPFVLVLDQRPRPVAAAARAPAAALRTDEHPRSLQLV